MTENIYKIEKRNIEENEYSLILRILVSFLIIIGFVIAVQTILVNMNLGFISLSIFTLIIGSAFSYKTAKSTKSWFNIAIAVAILFFLFSCKCCTCNIEHLKNLKMTVLYGLIFLQVFYSFFWKKRYNLMMAVWISMVFVGLSININFLVFWAPSIICYVFVLILVVVYEYLISRGYTVKSVKNFFTDVPFIHFAKVLLMVSIISLIIFVFLPRIQLQPGIGFNIYENIVMNGDFLTSIEKGSGNNDDPMGTDKSSQSNSFQGGTFDNDTTSDIDSNTIHKGFIKTKSSNGNGNGSSAISGGYSLLFSYQSIKPTYIKKMACDEYAGSKWKISDTSTYKTFKCYHNNNFRLFNPTKKEMEEKNKLYQKFVIKKLRTQWILTSYPPYDIYFPDDNIIIDVNNNYKAPAKMSEGYKYVTVSFLPDNNSFDLLLSLSNKDLTQKKPDNSMYKYLKLPESISNRTKKLAKTITDTSINDFHKVLLIKQYLEKDYTYSEDIKSYPEGVDPIDYFLFESKQGNNYLYSSAFSILLRASDVPSRFISGYNPGLLNPFTGYYEVRLNDKTSWVEAYLPDVNWIPIHHHTLQWKGTSILNVFIQYLLNFLLGIPFIQYILYLLNLLILNYPIIMQLVVIVIIIAIIVYCFIQYKKYSKTKSIDETVELYLRLCKKLASYGLKKSYKETALNYLYRIKRYEPSDKKAEKILLNIDLIEKATYLYQEIRFGYAIEKKDEFKNIIKGILDVI